MATIDVTLPVGLKTTRHSAAGGEEVVHRAAVLRELTTADLLNAGAEAEKAVRGDDGEYRLVQSPTLAGLHMLRRQIVKIGDIEGPFEVETMLKLDMKDFEALQDAAEKLDAAAMDSMKGNDRRGRDDTVS